MWTMCCWLLFYTFQMMPADEFGLWLLCKYFSEEEVPD